MLTINQTSIRCRFLAGPLGGMLPRQKGFVENAQSFGSRTSVPQGYNDPARALVSTIKTGGNISARFRGASTFTADLKATGNMAATFNAEAFFTAFGNVLGNISATFAAEAFFTAGIRATGNMAAVFDILARPSAFDIAQEVWNGQAAAYNVPGTMGASVQSGDVNAIAAAVWDRLLATHGTAGSAGEALTQAQKAAKLAAALSA